MPRARRIWISRRWVARRSWCRSSLCYADTRKGRRPSFLGAAEPTRAAELVEHLARALEAHGVRVGRGVFGAEMAIDLLNDGPFTIVFDTASP